MDRLALIRRWLLAFVVTSAAISACSVSQSEGAVEEVSIDVCGEPLVLADGYRAFDFSSTFGNEVPEGQDVWMLRSEVEGEGPPAAYSDMFVSAPREMLRIVDAESYSEWLGKILAADATYYEQGRTRLGSVFVGGCRVSTTLAPILPDHERPDDWAISLTVTSSGGGASGA